VQNARYGTIIRIAVLVLIAAVIFSACGQGNVTKEPSAAALMPSLAGYSVYNTLDLQDAMAKVAGAASLGSGNPELTALVAGVSGLSSCYQKAGGIEGRAYINQADISKAGIVVVVNRNVVTDPNTFLSCVSPRRALAPNNTQAQQPCAKTYTLNKDNNQYYIGYAATNSEVCQAFCAALQGCTP
jgi:hypothetical protein